MVLCSAIEDRCDITCAARDGHNEPIRAAAVNGVTSRGRRDGNPESGGSEAEDCKDERKHYGLEDKDMQL